MEGQIRPGMEDKPGTDSSKIDAWIEFFETFIWDYLPRNVCLRLYQSHHRFFSRGLQQNNLRAFLRQSLELSWWYFRIFLRMF